MKPVDKVFRSGPVVTRTTCVWLVACATFGAAAAGGCGLRPLVQRDLISVTDSGLAADARDAATVDLSGDVTNGVDAQLDLVGPTACTGDGCAVDQFCDELTGRCAPRTGAGMLGGVISDRCSGASLGARVGIAGRRQCSIGGKGSYFFANLPLGTLRLAVALQGYELSSTTVVITPGGSVADIVLTRSAPATCADPPPVVPLCQCLDPGCE